MFYSGGMGLMEDVNEILKDVLQTSDVGLRTAAGMRTGNTPSPEDQWDFALRSLNAVYKATMRLAESIEAIQARLDALEI
jgi:hypothetical protein